MTTTNVSGRCHLFSGESSWLRTTALEVVSVFWLLQQMSTDSVARHKLMPCQSWFLRGSSGGAGAAGSCWSFQQDIRFPTFSSLEATWPVGPSSRHWW